MQIRCSVLLLCICKHNTLVCRPYKVHMQYQLIYGKLSSITEGNTFVVMLKRFARNQVRHRVNIAKALTDHLLWTIFIEYCKKGFCTL